MIKSKGMDKIQVYIFVLLFISIVIIQLLPGIQNSWAQDTGEEWVAKIVSLQGVVQVKKGGEAQWTSVKTKEEFFSGDIIHVEKLGRVELMFCNGTTLRLDQDTTITLSGMEEKQTFLLDLIKGAVHFFSHIPRSLRLFTPFVNATVEGTEFFVRVEDDQAFLTVFEGQVKAANDKGTLTLASGQSAIAERGKSPVRQVIMHPRNAVQWALYYPPILYWRAADFQGGGENDWQAKVRKSIELYRENDLAGAFFILEGVTEDIHDPQFFLYRTSLFLSVGRIEEANADIKAALAIDPQNTRVFALQSIIAVIQNKIETSRELALKAIDADPSSAAARIAISYTQQADFDLSGALMSLKEAVKLEPKNAIAWARLAELWLMVGNLDKGLKAAREAATLNPNLAHIQTVLGFACLTQLRIQESIHVFESAIDLDQAAPLPRLGLGLAKIRKGDLKGGREEIEIAVSLSPDNSLIRSYLGKAYFEEKRNTLATGQFVTARGLDPLDPTPWFYDAIQKQTLNSPVESLKGLQKSIELNDNRAIYRSRLLLDEDLAARSASIARIYDELGFQQLALAEGWRSLNADPANYSAHRFLADSYSVLPGHEIARVSELLQSQLLQPVNITPVEPQLGESNLYILEGAGPSALSFNELNPLFFKNRISVQASGISGGNDTRGDEVVVSSAYENVSYSIGQFEYNTDGFRKNNDLNKDIYNLFAQVSLSHKTSIQAEFRTTEAEEGDLSLNFDPENFLDTLREDIKSNSMRLGLHHAFFPNSDIIASLIFRNSDEVANVSVPGMKVELDLKEEGYIAETQHLFRSERFRLISGIGYFSSERTVKKIFSFPDWGIETEDIEEDTIYHTNLYFYPQIEYPKNVTFTIGLSADFLKSAIVDRDLVNPKLGLVWNPFPATTLRTAVFRTLERTLISSQTIEPTQIAGFNQFFNDGEGTESWRYGIGIDQKFSKTVYSGVEFSKRDMDVPFLFIDDPNTALSELRYSDWKEKLIRAYTYWAIHPMVSVSVECQYEKLERSKKYAGTGEFTEIRTYRFPLGINIFHPSGVSAKIKATYADQKGTFGDPLSDKPLEQGKDNFWIIDASIGYRLPKRIGYLALEVRNIFNEKFRFQDTDPANPRIYPERLVFGKFTISF